MGKVIFLIIYNVFVQSNVMIKFNIPEIQQKCLRTFPIILQNQNSVSNIQCLLTYANIDISFTQIVKCFIKDLFPSKNEKNGNY